MKDINSPIVGPRVLLRDVSVEDRARRLRWSTVDTAWQDWDAPWEGKGLTSFATANCINMVSNIRWPQSTPRTQLWVQVIDGPLLGWVNAYHHDLDARAISIGICICESTYWHQGLGTEAFRLWMGYQFVHRDLVVIRTATWSANVRMIRVAEKCGFILTHHHVGNREVRGQTYDGLAFELTREHWDGWMGEER